MRHGSLFSGIGGFDLAAEWMEWENVFHCEWNKFGQRVLKYYWPKAISYEDITKTDFTIHRGGIDVLTGGFPCQPYSTSGKRKGSNDERHLWPEMLRAIREISPRYIVGENVRGLVNWNAGVVFDQVQIDLEDQGYEVQPFLLPACAVNAPHKRERIWFVAFKNTDSDGRGSNERQEKSEAGKQRDLSAGDSKRIYSDNGEVDFVSNTFGGKRSFRWDDERMGRSWKQSQENAWNEFPTVSPFCKRDDGLSSDLDGIAFHKWRKESLKAAGNAIVPQVALQIFKAIQQYENNLFPTLKPN